MIIHGSSSQNIQVSSTKVKNKWLVLGLFLLLQNSLKSKSYFKYKHLNQKFSLVLWTWTLNKNQIL